MEAGPHRLVRDHFIFFSTRSRDGWDSKITFDWFRYEYQSVFFLSGWSFRDTDKRNGRIIGWKKRNKDNQRKNRQGTVQRHRNKMWRFSIFLFDSDWGRRNGFCFFSRAFESGKTWKTSLGIIGQAKESWFIQKGFTQSVRPAYRCALDNLKQKNLFFFNKLTEQKTEIWRTTVKRRTLKFFSM
jgi:hypothetical protein